MKQEHFEKLMLEQFIREHPELGGPENVPALREYFSDLPLLPWHNNVHCDELRIFAEDVPLLCDEVGDQLGRVGTVSLPLK